MRAIQGVLTAGLALALLTGGCAGVQEVAKEKGTTPAAVIAGKKEIENSLAELARKINTRRNYSEADRYMLLQQVLENNRKLFGAAWAVRSQGDLADVYYVYVDGQTLVTRADKAVDTADPAYAWYRNARGSGGVWSEPYQVDDFSGNRLRLITYSMEVMGQGDGQHVPAFIACDYLLGKEPTPAVAPPQTHR